jgi:hypothetical protein
MTTVQLLFNGFKTLSKSLTDAKDEGLLENSDKKYSEKDIDELCKLIKHNEMQWDLFDNGIIKIKPKSYDEITKQFKNK